MNADDIAAAVVRGLNTRTTLVVPNVSWGLVSYGECDILAMSKTGYLTEYEIKVSASDIRREWAKKRWTKPHFLHEFRQMIKTYFVVVPDDLVDVVCGIMPEAVGGGVVSVRKADDGLRTKIVRQPLTNTRARKLNASEQYQLARLGCIRYWARFSKPDTPYEGLK